MFTEVEDTGASLEKVAKQLVQRKRELMNEGNNRSAA